MLTLQHQAQRRSSYRGFAPVEWSGELRSWCVFDPDSMIAILKSTDFGVVDYAAEYGKLAERTRIDWSGLVDALHNIPLANEGERHTRLRRDFAQVIGERSALAKAAAQQFLAKTVPLVFRNSERAELVQDLVRPLNDAVFGELLGMPVPKTGAKGLSVSQIFDRFLGLNRRKALQCALAQLSQVIAYEAGLGTSADFAIALLVVGQDSLAASLGASLVVVLEEVADARLCDLDYPDALPGTGVPYVERVAQTDCTIHGFKFHVGDRVRLFLDACTARGSAYEEAPFFGRGRHLCLGKDLSQSVWRMLTHELTQLPVRVRITETKIRPNDYVFTMYDRIEVTIHA